MTRINCDLNPKLLMDQHLFAEYRELPRVFDTLRKSLHNKSIDAVLRDIPSRFTLNTGHMKHFYDKLVFLEKRHQALIEELIIRNYKISNVSTLPTKEFPNDFRNDWKSVRGDREIIVERLKEKITMKPDFYRYYGDKVSLDFIEKLYD